MGVISRDHMRVYIRVGKGLYVHAIEHFIGICRKYTRRFRVESFHKVLAVS